MYAVPALSPAPLTLPGAGYCPPRSKGRTGFQPSLSYAVINLG